MFLTEIFQKYVLQLSCDFIHFYNPHLVMIWFLVNESFAIRYVFGIHFVTFKSRILKKGALLLSFKLCHVYQRKGL